jgi:NAD+ kinase
MATVAIISKPQKSELQRVLPELLDWLRRRRYTVLVDPETASYVSGEAPTPRAAIADHNPQFVIVLGGDGTLLAAARVLARSAIPLLAVNLGSLGFLTEVPLAELYPNLQSVIDGSCAVDSRAMLHCELWRKQTLIAEYDALNDVVTAQGTIARMTEYMVEVDGVFVSNYKADGLIVCTPTGSTAYSLAAGGPVLVPTVKALVITPVSPHALTNRPLVVPDTSKITVTAVLRQQEAVLTVDGQIGLDLQDDDQIRCQRSQYCVKLLRVPDRHKFFEVLRNKLHWGHR